MTTTRRCGSMVPFLALIVAVGCGGTGRSSSPRDAAMGSDGRSGGISGGGGGTGGVGTGGVAGSGGSGSGGRGSGGLLGSGGGLGGASGGSGAANGGGAAASGGKGSGGGAATVPCPGSPPVNGSTCSAPVGDGDHCTWGDSPRTECRTIGSCSGVWHIFTPPAYCAGLDPACPTSAPSAFATCSTTSLTCAYSATLCSCTPCNSDGAPGPPFIRCNGQPFGTPVWDCNSAPTPSPPCPSVVPNRGAACGLPATTGCPAGTCGDLNVTCAGGVWSWTYPPITCPSCIRNCATCASPGTPIATPSGERPISEIRVGDLVYSVVDRAIRPVVVIRVSRTPVVNHHVVRVTTADGRVLEISAGHPTADGRLFADLRPDGLLDSVSINRVETVPYLFSETYDILPASESGTYFAAGLLIGSTLAR